MTILDQFTNLDITKEKRWKLRHPKLHKKRNKEYNRAYWKKIKAKILLLLGNKCVKCGFKDIRPLQIDHINGGGRKEIESFTCRKNYYLYLLKYFKSHPNQIKYQLLCANCNWIKKAENKEVYCGDYME